MDVFYNVKGIGDVLIIPLEKGNQYDIFHEKFGDITRITNGEGHVLGYNIFQASTHLSTTNTGKFPLTVELLDKLQALFKAEGISDSLDFDLDRKSTRLNSSHVAISYAVFCLKKKKEY